MERLFCQSQLQQKKHHARFEIRACDKQAFRHLVRSADVLIENFRPGVMERLELDYDRLEAINPKLVYGCIRGFWRSAFWQKPL